MPSSTGRILKRDEVTVSGRRHLDSPRPRTHASPSAQPQGRIVEQDNNGAIVEVTCGCGEVFHLHCTYEAPPELPADG